MMLALFDAATAGRAVPNWQADKRRCSLLFLLRLLRSPDPFQSTVQCLTWLHVPSDT
jgi:hypothetical protein